MAALTPALITINNKPQNASLGCRNTYVYTICVSAKGLSTDVQAKYGRTGASVLEIEEHGVYTAMHS